MRLLLVASDARFCATLQSWMGMAGSHVDWLLPDVEVESTLQGAPYDAMLLEDETPGRPAEALLHRLRRAGYELPLVIISSRDDTQARIRLLDLGADDYLVKPVRLDELAARLRVLLRRSRAGVQARGELRHGPLRVVPDSRSVSKDGSRVSLTATEYSLLEVLMRAKGEVLTRQSLEDLLKGRFDEHGGNPLEVHVHHLRRKLGAGVITTIRGVGYTLGNGNGNGSGSG